MEAKNNNKVKYKTKEANLKKLKMFLGEEEPSKTDKDGKK